MTGNDARGTIRTLAALFCLGWLLPCTGCGVGGPRTSPATGTVLYNGEPLEGATVLFSRGQGDLASGEMSLSVTDAQGRFELSTHLSGQEQVKGVAAGQYQVTISKKIPPDGMSLGRYQEILDAANEMGRTGAVVPPDKQPPQLVEMLPARYSTFGQSELKAEVTADGPNQFEFKLE